ncbi:MAG: hypothetical protein Q9172_007530, partial [Xanthocarpia lactea]
TALTSNHANTVVPTAPSSTSDIHALPPGKIAMGPDSKLVAEIEERLERFQPLLKPTSQRRALYGLTLKASGSTLQSSGTSSSAPNIGAASTTFAKLSAHLDEVLLQNEVTASDSLRFTTYLEKQQSIPIHSFAVEELKTFNSTFFEWQLIKHAADASYRVYEAMPDFEDGQMVEAKGQRKAMIVYIDVVDGRRMLIVGVRGTVTMDDWMLNVNRSPRKYSKMFLKTALWHGGFLAVAETMAKRIARIIQEMHRDIVNEGDPVPQAQEEFIKTLIDVYVLASGHQVILRDADPDDLDSNNIQVYTTESSVLEKKLFGNPFVHPMKEYLDRIKGLGDLGLK